MMMPRIILQIGFFITFIPLNDYNDDDDDLEKKNK